MNVDMETKTEDELIRDVIKEILYEVYEKANDNEVLLAKEVIGEMVQKLRPFYVK